MANTEGFQYRLEDSPEKIQGSVKFLKGTVIYPEHGGRGVLTADLFALPLNRKIKGLSGYEARSSSTVYLDGRENPILYGSFFGAYSNKARKVAHKK